MDEDFMGNFEDHGNDQDDVDQNDYDLGDGTTAAIDPGKRKRDASNTCLAIIEKCGTVALPEDVRIPEARIDNLVASVQLGCAIDLRRLVTSARNVEYNPRRLNAAVVRLQEPAVTGLVFGVGKMSILGTKDAGEAKRGGRIMAKLVKKCGHPQVKFINFKIETLLASANAGFPVRLEKFASEVGEFCLYEPEMFCGAVFRYNANGIQATIIVFVSGRMMVSGCRDAQNISKVVNDMYPVLWQYRDVPGEE